MKTKIIIVSITLIALVFGGAWELHSQRQFDSMVAERDVDLEKKKPLYDCLIAAAALVDESPSAEEVMAVGVAEHECYERFNEQ